MKRDYYVLPDTHLGHDKMKKDGYRPENFETLIIENLWSTVKPGDVIIHLGDVSFYNHEMWHQRLLDSCPQCHWWLTYGNHDKKSMSWYLEAGWSMACQTFSLQLFGKHILLSHRPVPNHGYDLNIHGHVHDRPGPFGPYKSVYLEHEYKPVLLRSLVEW